jgi:hypothetical protein
VIELGAVEVTEGVAGALGIEGEVNAGFEVAGLEGVWR